VCNNYDVQQRLLKVEDEPFDLTVTIASAGLMNQEWDSRRQITTLLSRYESGRRFVASNWRVTHNARCNKLRTRGVGSIEGFWTALPAIWPATIFSYSLKAFHRQENQVQGHAIGDKLRYSASWRERIEMEPESSVGEKFVRPCDCSATNSHRGEDESLRDSSSLGQIATYNKALHVYDDTVIHICNTFPYVVACFDTGSSGSEFKMSMKP
jgi:hypothetical protein